MNDCPRFGKWIGGCKFEPRYDVGPPDFSAFTRFKNMHAGFAETLKPEKYICDVCVRCGKTTKNPGTE